MKNILTDKIDVLIPLGIGSKWDNNEIKYSLRSIEQNLSNLGNIYIIGSKPDWLTNVIHVPFQDPHTSSLLRNQNILQKILFTIRNYDVSNNFIFTNDDIFFLKPMVENQIHNFTDCTMQDYLQRNPLLNGVYKRAFRATIQYLMENNLPMQHYDNHTPIIYNKFKFEKIFADIKQEIVIKSIYGNSITPIINDNKIYKPLSLRQIENQNENQPFFSVSDKALNDEMKEYLKTKFNKNSQYEQHN